MMYCTMCVQKPKRPAEGTRTPGTGVTGGFEPHTRVLGTEPSSSATAVNSLNCCTPTPGGIISRKEVGSELRLGGLWE